MADRAEEEELRQRLSVAGSRGHLQGQEEEEEEDM
jgi:hypothetical protein